MSEELTSQTKPRSDLGVRTLSGVIMMTVAAVAIWFGGWIFIVLVVAVGLGVFWEWWGLVSKIARTRLALALWLSIGVSYVGFSMFYLVALRNFSATTALAPIALVIGVDVGAYFAGRTFGGPKIAPKISPSKTWAGLAGGAFGAAIIHSSYAARASGELIFNIPSAFWLGILVTSLAVAIVAQAGDFFESWMKRRAGVKDSSNLIPGHGGLFDRADGLLAVLAVGGLVHGVWQGFF
jgi:phosphatidate cytidylyltransferase